MLFETQVAKKHTGKPSQSLPVTKIYYQSFKCARIILWGLKSTDITSLIVSKDYDRKQIYVDTGNYMTIKKVIFSAKMRNFNLNG